MIEKVIIKENSELSKILNVKEIGLKKLTVLIGLNGHGKSSLLNAMIGFLCPKNSLTGHHKLCSQGIYVFKDAEREYIYISFLGREDNGKYRGYFGDDIGMDLNSLFSSEGISTINTFYDKLVTVQNIAKNSPDKNVVFFVDEADSGLSVNNLMLINAHMKKALNEYPNLQIIMTANNYEVVSVFPENILWVKDGEYITFESYEDYRSYYKNKMYDEFKNK